MTINDCSVTVLHPERAVHIRLLCVKCINWCMGWICYQFFAVCHILLHLNITFQFALLRRKQIHVNKIEAKVTIAYQKFLLAYMNNFDYARWPQAILQNGFTTH